MEINAVDELPRLEKFESVLLPGLIRALCYTYMLKVLFGFRSVHRTDQLPPPQKLGYLNVLILASFWVLIKEE